jgi:dTDP-L-rhamnose 4-epimerase
MKVLVTGGAGFIGSHIVDSLVEEGADVLSIDSLDPGVYRQAPAYLNARADYCFADLRTWRPDERFDDVEAVVHCAAIGGVSRAAREPANLIDINVTGTARLLGAMRSWTSLQRVVVASSFSVYGANYTYQCRACGALRSGDRSISDLEASRFEVVCAACGGDSDVLPLSEAVSPDPIELYGASKYMQELCLRGFLQCPVVLLRQSSVYGPRLRLDDGEATIIAKIAGWLRSKQPPKLLEDGRQIRDWVHVSDTVAAVLAIVAGAHAPPIVNVCTGVPTTLSEACTILGELLGASCGFEVVGGFRPGDMRHCLGDPTVLTQLIGRKPTPFSEGAPRSFAGA